MAEYFAYGNYKVNYNGETESQDALNTHRFTRNDIRTAENQLDPKSSFDNSKVMLSTNIFIYSNGGIIGMLQNFAVQENRTINKLQAIGWEGVVQSVPSNTRGGSLNVTRIALYDSTLYNALGLNTYASPHNQLGRWHHYSKSHTTGDTTYDAGDGWDTYQHQEALKGPTVTDGVVFRTLKDQRAPLEIQVRTRMQGTEAAADYYVVTYVDCWLSQC